MPVSDYRRGRERGEREKERPEEVTVERAGTGGQEDQENQQKEKMLEVRRKDPQALPPFSWHLSPFSRPKTLLFLGRTWRAMRRSVEKREGHPENLSFHSRRQSRSWTLREQQRQWV